MPLDDPIARAVGAYCRAEAASNLTKRGDHGHRPQYLCRNEQPRCETTVEREVVAMQEMSKFNRATHAHAIVALNGAGANALLIRKDGSKTQGDGMTVLNSNRALTSFSTVL